MADEHYWARYRWDARRRAGARAALIFTPFLIAFSFGWALFLPGYSPGDPRADLLWRLAVMAAFDAFYVAVATSALLWLLADRRGEKKPPRPDEKKGGRSQA